MTALAGVALYAGAAQAQGLAADLRGAINAGGESCAQVTRYEGAAAVADSDNVLIAAACSGGERYVVSANQRTGDMRLVSSCADAKASGLVTCFRRRQ